MSKLVTGADGFIAKNLSADIKIGKEIDFTNYEMVRHVFNYHKPSTVIHCAARHGSAIEMIENHTRYIENNIISDINVIKACHEVGVKNLLMLSTITSFDPESKSPFSEESVYGRVNEKIFGYAYSKKICVGLCKAYQLDFGLNYKSIFLGNTYGPHGKFHDSGTVIHNLVYKFVKAKSENTNVHLFGDGKAVRNYLYSGDLDSIFDRILFDQSIVDPVIVSAEKQNSIIDIVNIIKEYISFENEVIFDSDKVIGDQIKVADISKLKKIIGDYKFTDLKTGIHKTIDWYIGNLK